MRYFEIQSEQSDKAVYINPVHVTHVYIEEEYLNDDTPETYCLYFSLTKRSVHLKFEFSEEKTAIYHLKAYLHHIEGEA